MWEGSRWNRPVIKHITCLITLIIYKTRDQSVARWPSHLHKHANVHTVTFILGNVLNCTCLDNYRLLPLCNRTMEQFTEVLWYNLHCFVSCAALIVEYFVWLIGMWGTQAVCGWCIVRAHLSWALLSWMLGIVWKNRLWELQLISARSAASSGLG